MSRGKGRRVYLIGRGSLKEFWLKNGQSWAGNYFGYFSWIAYFDGE